jgi:hypothetical protein
MKGFSADGFEGAVERALGRTGVAPKATEEEMLMIARAVVGGERDWKKITW